MSDVVAVPPIAEKPAKRVPTVYFIDDSATMREVIKIAFRRENINIITCPNAASALGQFEQNPPDVVITDVIMPDEDGYSICTQVKQHPKFGATPVILMSGVVNKGVADKALAVQADELMRKPFQAQELIARVRNFLEPKGAAPEAGPAATSALGSLFARAPQASPAPTLPAGQRSADSAWPRALAEAFSPPQPQQPAQHRAPRSPAGGDPPKLHAEIARLELLVKKLQTELQLERQYNEALEAQIKALTGSE